MNASGTLELFPDIQPSFAPLHSPVRVLVTGAAGFVGRHLLPRLVEEGFMPFGIDKNAGNHSPLVVNIGLEEFLVDYQSLCSWDTVIHLAANIVDIDRRMKMGVRAFEDLVLDYKMCEWLQEIKPKRVVFMSSCAVDGLDDPYSAVKRNLEAMIRPLQAQGLECIILRPFSGYGADQSLHYPFRAILERALNHEDPLTVWGGTQVRDWLYIDDLVEAIVHGVKGKFPEGIPIDIGTGFGTDFLRTARMIADEVGYHPQIAGDDTKAQSSQFRIAMPNLAASYGWKFKIPFADGIRKAVKLRWRSGDVQL